MKKKNQLRHTQNSYHPEDAEIDTPLLTIMVRGTQENGGRSLVSRNMYYGMYTCTHLTQVSWGRWFVWVHYIQGDVHNSSCAWQGMTQNELGYTALLIDESTPSEHRSNWVIININSRTTSMPICHLALKPISCTSEPDTTLLLTWHNQEQS